LPDVRVELNKIVKKYGAKKALDIPSWLLEDGEVVGLVGSNGAGKTTFLRILLDLLEADHGHVRMDGRNVRQDASWRARTGSFLDRTFLIEYLTIPEYLEFVGTTFGLSKRETSERLEPFESFLPLSRIDQKRLIRDLSTGNAKKVGILAALFVHPEFVVLDEPFANLDPPSQIKLKQLLADMAADPGRSMIISSHDLGHVTDVCGRITLLQDGMIEMDLQTSEKTLEELNSWFSDEGISSAT
jgi:ABC-2 type transport system ATP-binding protein